MKTLSLCVLLAFSSAVYTEEANNPSWTVTIKILDQGYPTNNKILVGGSGNTQTLNSKTTPPDTGTYTWSYAKDLQFKPNKAKNAKTTELITLSAPFPDSKDTENVEVAFESNTGHGAAKDKRPLNFVAPEHFKADQPNPKTTDILKKGPKIITIFQHQMTYTIQDKYKETLAETTADFAGGTVFVRESAEDWTSSFMPKPRMEKDWLKRNKGELVDNLVLDIDTQTLIDKATNKYKAGLKGMEIATGTHKWVAKANSTTEYTVAKNKISVVVTDVNDQDGIAKITVTYTLVTP